jgi:small-conductance mechanosensitive channel
VLAPIDFSRLEAALTTPLGLADLAIVALCIGLAWLVDQRLHARSHAGDPRMARIHADVKAGVARVVFALVGLALLLIGRYAYRRWGGTPLFIDLAIPLMVALAAIRMLVYGMRRLFADQAWLKTSERAIAFTIWGLAILWFIGVLPEVARELDEVALPVGKTSVTVLTVGKSIVAIVVTVIVALWVSGLIEQRLLGATSLDTNIKAVLAKFVRAVLLVAGVLFALDAIGFDLTLLTVFSGALGVGIGLGLQKLAANYIAGFTILIDKSIRLGDLITVDNRHGVVAAVTSRYVVVRSNDGTEAIVPNETLVTTSVLRHPHAGNEFKLMVPIQVAYDTDIPLAMRLMADAARAEPSTLEGERAPGVQIIAFADSGINLELTFWVRNPPGGHGAVRSAVSARVLEAFDRAGIVIPNLRRDLRLAGGAYVPGAGAPASGANAGKAPK